MGTIRKSRICGRSPTSKPLRDDWLGKRLSKFVSALSWRRLLRPLLVASLGTALAGTAVWSVAGMVATTGSSLTLGSSHVNAKPQVYPANGPKARLSGVRIAAGKAPRLVKVGPQLFQSTSLAADPGKPARHPDVAPAAAPDGKATPFDAVVKHAAVTSEKLAQPVPSLRFASQGCDRRDRRAGAATARLAARRLDRSASDPARLCRSLPGRHGRRCLVEFAGTVGGRSGRDTRPGPRNGRRRGRAGVRGHAVPGSRAAVSSARCAGRHAG